MILNEDVIRNNVLKNTLIEEIIKSSKKIGCVSIIYEKIGMLTEKTAAQDNVLQQLRQKYALRQQKLQRQKETLKQELKAKTFYKMTLKEALEGEMKILQQNCHFIREKKQTLAELKSKQSRLMNQLQELEIYEKEADTDAQRLELKSIYDKKIQSEETETVKQLLMLIEAKRNEILKENKFMAILNLEVDDKQRKITKLKQEKDTIEIGVAQILPTLEKQTQQTSKRQKQVSQIKQNLSKLSSETSKLSYSVHQSLLFIQNNDSRSEQLAKTISELIEESNSLNQKVIKTREYVTYLNTIKNNQKKLNQQLKLKVRQLMKITIDHSSFSS